MGDDLIAWHFGERKVFQLKKTQYTAVRSVVPFMRRKNVEKLFYLFGNFFLINKWHEIMGSKSVKVLRTHQNWCTSLNNVYKYWKYISMESGRAFWMVFVEALFQRKVSMNFFFCSLFAFLFDKKPKKRHTTLTFNFWRLSSHQWNNFTFGKYCCRYSLLNGDE